ncbi:M10 family metallopeptidase C-terminal domain-containing protein [Roseibium sp. SCP14]|uniref:M10 family metallopeptidase C-terminal domain-containing protein n=1 Tax=Roseibium sp. SCP14 TaxID=3141375 RepID=UPI003335F3DF
MSELLENPIPEANESAEQSHNALQQNRFEGEDAASSIDTIYTISAGDTFTGYREEAGSDWVRIELTAGQKYIFTLEEGASPAIYDPFLRLRDSNGVLLESDDNSGGILKSRLVYEPTSSGTYYLEAQARSRDGGNYVLGTELSEPLPTYTNDQIADYLVSGYWQDIGETARSFDISAGGSLNVSLDGMIWDRGKAFARYALEVWSSVTGINFNYVSGDAHITFDDNDYRPPHTTHELDGSTITSATVTIDMRFLNGSGQDPSGRGIYYYIREVGRALGLGYTGDIDAVPYQLGIDNNFLNDSWHASVMSLFNQYTNPYVDAPTAYPRSPAVADILAIQQLYGSPASVHAGDTVYGFNSAAGGNLDDLVNATENFTATIIDTSGTDTFDFSGYSVDQVIDLQQEHESSVGGSTGFFFIARGSVIEHAIGGSGNDTIIGNDVDNTLEGGDGNDILAGLAGADSLNGGAGEDWVHYDASDAAVTVNLSDASAETGGHAQGDLLSSIENVLGSAFADTITGDSGTNILNGHDGDDTIYGEDGNDTLLGGAGADRLFGGGGEDWTSYEFSDAGVNVGLSDAAVETGGHAEGDLLDGIENVLGSVHNDTLTGDGLANVLRGNDGDDALFGGDGNDILNGEAGADSLNGGAGFDWAYYDISQAAVTIDLSDNSAESGGQAEGDVLTDIEGIFGSIYADSISGNAQSNTFRGNEGDDVLSGYGGADTLQGDAGNDILIGGADADNLDGGLGTDWAYYETSNDAVEIDLSDNAAETGGHAEGDTLSGIENILGSVYADRITGDAYANYLRGHNGDDVLSGGSGNDILKGDLGADRLNGGSGLDWAYYESSNEAVQIDMSDGEVEAGGHAEGDELTSVENILGSAFNDTIRGSASANVLHGLGGNDSLYGEEGNDTLQGQAGADILIGGAGADILNGGEGEDTASFHTSDAGVKINLSDNLAELGGHAAGDILVDIERIMGSTHDDVITGSALKDYFRGGNGDDTLSGLHGDDTLFGDGGNDVLIGGFGFDVLNGGEGIDWASYHSSDYGVIVDLSDADSEYGGDAQGDTLIDIENVRGSISRDVITGDEGANAIRGNNGNDSLFGAAGDDTLLGETGDDHLIGGAGADFLNGGTGNDTAFYDASSAGVTVSLAAGAVGVGGDAQGDTLADVENLYGSLNGDYLTGNALNNTLTGIAGDDILSGEEGDDTLEGGVGDDILIGGYGDDTLDGGTGSDTISYISANGSVSVDLRWSGRDIGAGYGRDRFYSIENITGSDYDDRLTGDAGDNVLDGGAGNDVISGKGGNDTLSGGDGNDRLRGGNEADALSGGSGEDVLVSLGGDDTLTGGAGKDYVYGGQGNDKLFGNRDDDRLRGNRGNDEMDGGNGNDDLRGGGNNDTIYGGAGDDFILGENGNDTINGGAGNDTLRGGSGGAAGDGSWDIFVFNRGDDFDKIKDFEIDRDKIDLSDFNFSGFGEVLALAEDRATGLRIDFGDGDILFIDNVFTASLSAGDVIL